MKNLISILAIISLLLFSIKSGYSQITYLEGVYNSSVDWGDYNNDGFKDILLSGEYGGNKDTTIIYKNNGDGTFTDININLPGIRQGTAKWGDYDKDNDLDILLYGSGNAIVYRNDGGGSFTNINAVFSGLTSTGCFGVWGCFSNDIYLDILFCDSNTEIYYNNTGGDTFLDFNAGLPNISQGCAAVGDLNNDAYPDIILCSEDTTRIFKNNGGAGFVEVETGGFMSFTNGSVELGDFNRDFYIDILITGKNDVGNPVSKVYKNNGNLTFTEQNQINLTGVYNGSVAWQDYNNDEYQDILITGLTEDGTNPVSKIYKNNRDGTFTEQTQIELRNVYQSSVAWGDFNNDNYPDLLLTGNASTGLSEPVSIIYKNKGDGTFSEHTKKEIDYTDMFHRIDTLTGVYFSSVTWGNYNGDDYPDILLTGESKGQNGETNPISKIYKNNKDETFEEQTHINLTGVKEGAVAWGDYNNDTHTDILLTGKSANSTPISKIYKNDGDGNYYAVNVNLPGVYESSVTWLDFDNDDDLDILLAGKIDFSTSITKIYENKGGDTFDEISTNLPILDYGLVTAVGYNEAYKFQYLFFSGEGYSYIYENDGDGTFTSIIPDLSDDWFGSADWGDFNDDGRLDLLVSSGDSTIVFRNDGSDIFTRIVIATSGIYEGDAIWGNFAGDEKLDFLLSGLDDGGYPLFKIYRNDGNDNFTEITTTGVQSSYDFSSTACADLNKDGQMDVLIAGTDYFGNKKSRIYKNNGNTTFSELKQRILPNLYHSNISFADFDKNGKLSVLLTGYNGTKPVSQIYDFTDNTFQLTDISLTGVQSGYSTLGDYNNDGYIDILLTGTNKDAEPISKIYQNGGNGLFLDAGIYITGVYDSYAEWTDYNNDGYLDFLICGKDDADNQIAKVYRNIDGTNFIETNIKISGAKKALWGNDNKDGYYDILFYDKNRALKLLTGEGNNKFTETDLNSTIDEPYDVIWTDGDNDGNPDIYSYDEIELNALSCIDFTNSGNKQLAKSGEREEGSLCTKLPENEYLPGVKYGSHSWADYDNDSCLDFFITGVNVSPISEIWGNSTETANIPPNQPTNLRLEKTNGDTAFIAWDKAIGGKTPTDGLTYNCYMYEVNGDTIWHSMSNQKTGKRYIVKGGNVGHNTIWFITGLEVDKWYKWSVQAIDNSFAGGQFAAEDSFRLAPQFTTQPESQRICSESSAMFNVTTTNRDSIQWEVNEGSGFIKIQNNDIYDNSGTQNLIIKKVDTTMHNHQYRARAVTMGGETFSNIAELEIDTLILATAGPDTTFCSETFITSANMPVNSIGEWTCEDSQVSINEINSNITTISNLPAGNTKLTWTVTQNNVCGQNSDDVILESERTPSQATVPSGETQCVSGTKNYQTTPVSNATSYTWSIAPSEAGEINGNGIFATVNWNSDFYGDIQIKVLGANSCSNIAWSDPLNIIKQEKPLDPQIPSGNTKICKGSSNILYTTQIVQNASSYIWNLSPSDAGAITENGTNATINWNSDFSGNAQIKVKAVGCGESNWSDVIFVTVYDEATVPDIPAEPKGETLVCLSSNENYTVNEVLNADSYIWEINPPEAGIISGNAKNASVNFNDIYTGKADIKVKGVNSCGIGDWSTNLEISISPRALRPAKPEGDIYICMGTTNTNFTSLGVTDVTNYEWNIYPETAGSISGNTKIGQAAWNTTFSGDVSIKVRAVSCEAGDWSDELNLTIFSNVPEKLNIPTGESILCRNPLNTTYTSILNSNSVKYIWELSNTAGTFNSDQNSVIINWDETFTGTTTLKVKGENECGQGDFSNELTININDVPQKTDKPNGETKICSNGLTSYLVGAVPFSNSYMWQVSPFQAGEITGNTVQITIDWLNNYTGTAYIKVKGLNQCGEGDYSDSLKVTLNKPVASNIIQKSSIMLISADQGYNYQWYINGAPISDATKQYYYNENMQTGDYQIEITDNGGCKSLSDIFSYQINKSFSLEETIKVYPNPTSGQVTFEIDNDYICKIQYRIIDASGKSTKSDVIVKDQKIIKTTEDLSSLNSGNYLIVFIFEGNEKVSKQLIVK
ncbi:MAG: T9SS type A sorting domain-containing protein [bacterium]|nr:T9SS type A sorting domain-containing protein [bacterium]